MKRYTQMRLQLDGFNSDLLSTVLFEAGCSGIEEVSDRIWLVSFVDELSAAEVGELAGKLQRLNAGMKPGQAVFSSQPVEDWNREWKQHFKPLKIGRSVWVAPPWDKPAIAPGERLVIIDPQMAFGTGSHETTQLLIELLEDVSLSGRKVLDAGTGSGILSLLARMMGSGPIFAFDIEAEAIDNARLNAEINSVEGIEFMVGDESVISERTFDLILANINRVVLENLLPLFTARLNPGGLLMLSGVLAEEGDKIKAALPEELVLREIRSKKEWIALLLVKSGKR